jgi:hypothetical protein
VTSTTTVARAVAKRAENQARAALAAVLAAHSEIVDSEAALAQARQRRVAAGPALASAIEGALAIGITAEQLA